MMVVKVEKKSGKMFSQTSMQVEAGHKRNTGNDKRQEKFHD